MIPARCNRILAYVSQGHRTPGASVRAAVAQGWGVLLSAAHDVADPITHDYVLDNGAWSAHQAGVEFGAEHAERFISLLDRHGWGAQWCVAPDIVGGGLRSLELSERWLDRCLDRCGRVLIPVQEGMTPADLEDLVGCNVGIFVGGESGAWKESTTPAWVELAERKCAYVHVGRVNSCRRIALVARAGANSFDGTGPVIQPTTLGRLDGSVRQGRLF